ncbi:hypothetical protein H5410_018997 [Solanum commersonii]|uniref:Uncharacterized protein n=1 Tax=Solanum commersonii TaxID=4109 RepID=A0A9J6A3M9_SOLCO|nr:hypothetical protein H5410_018997 [Solanum commersonii]
MTKFSAESKLSRNRLYRKLTNIQAKKLKDFVDYSGMKDDEIVSMQMLLVFIEQSKGEKSPQNVTDQEILERWDTIPVFVVRNHNGNDIDSTNGLWSQQT